MSMKNRYSLVSALNLWGLESTPVRIRIGDQTYPIRSVSASGDAGDLCVEVIAELPGEGRDEEAKT